MNCNPVPVILNSESKQSFPSHRHNSASLFHKRAQCGARCRCGHLCAWHYELDQIVSKCCADNCICTQFADQ